MKNREESLKRGLIKNWAFSYLGVCLIPIIFFIAFAFSISSILIRSASSENKIVLNSIKRLLDGTIEQSLSLSEDILLSSVLTTNVIYASESEINSTKLFEASTALRHLLNSYDYISDAAIYSPQLNIYLSPMRWGSFDDLILRNELELPFSESERSELFQSNEIKSLTLLDASYTNYLGNRVERLLIIKPISYAFTIGGGKPLYIATIIDMDKVLPLFLSENRNFLIIDKERNEIVFNWDGNSEIDKESKLLNLKSDETVLIEKNIATAEDASLAGISYVILVNRSVYNRYVNTSIILALIMFLLAMSLGLLFIYIRTKKEWNVFLNAVEKTDAEVDWTTSLDSVYTPFVSSIEKQQEKENVMGHLIREQTKSLQSSMLSHLVDNSSLVSEESLNECGIDFISDLFLVVLICLENEEKKLDIQEIESENFVFFPFKSSFSFSAIVNINKNLKKEEIYQLFARLMKELIDKNLNIKTSAASDVSVGLKSVGKDYIEAINIIEYLNESPSREFVFNRDVLGMIKKKSFSYSTEDELKLESFIEHGDSLGAQNLVKELVEKNKNRAIGARNLRYLLFSIAGTLVRSENKIKNEYSWNLPDISFSSIMQSDNFDKSLLEVLKNLDAICKSIEKERIENKEFDDEYYKIYRKALTEISKSYQDSLLNISELATRLSVSNTTLSKAFKKYHSSNISDYLSQYRVNMAKKYLSEGKTNLEIIKLCGFGSERTFLRLFKTFEDTTPGKYREIRGKKKHE